MKFLFTQGKAFKRSFNILPFFFSGPVVTYDSLKNNASCTLLCDLYPCPDNKPVCKHKISKEKQCLHERYHFRSDHSSSGKFFQIFFSAITILISRSLHSIPAHLWSRSRITSLGNYCYRCICPHCCFICDNRVVLKKLKFFNPYKSFHRLSWKNKLGWFPRNSILILKNPKTAYVLYKRKKICSGNLHKRSGSGSSRSSMPHSGHEIQDYNDVEVQIIGYRDRSAEAWMKNLLYC